MRCKSHDAFDFVCTPCTVVCPTQHVLQAHLNGKRHRAQVEGQRTALYCPVCQAEIYGMKTWSLHTTGRRHLKSLRARGINLAIEPLAAGPIVPGRVFCAACRIYTPESADTKHSSSKVHLRRLQFFAADALIQEAATDKHGVTISRDPVLGSGSGITPQETAQAGLRGQFSVTNTSPSSDIVLKTVQLSSAASEHSSPFAVTLLPAEKKIFYDQNTVVGVTFLQEFCGIYTDRVEFLFEDRKLKRNFTIARSLQVTVVGDVAEYIAMQPKAPYVPRTRGSRAVESEVVAGEPPPSLNAIPYVVKLTQATLPQHTLDVLSSRGSLSYTVKQVKSLLLPPTFDHGTYGRHFKCLLWAEEYRSEQDLQIYDIEGTRLGRHNDLYYLKVPGLAEKRPSVLVGDRIFIQSVQSDPENGKWFEGCVHVVRRDEVGMKFGRPFHAGHSESQTYRARFKLNRFPLRRQHQALDTICTQERILFPETHMTIDRVLPNIDDIASSLYNKLIADNPPQLQAVASIAFLPAGAVTFLLFGPPGTGKTVCVVEAILQLLRLHPHATILACAPSNSAADLIASRLATKLGADKMFRFYAPSRYKNSVPDELEKYSITNLNGHFTVPPFSKLKSYRVVVSTCVSASFAYGVGMPRGHFTHMFFDEAGHATEPELMIAVKTMADNDTNVILSGDPKQLGPIIRSPVARELGLERSFLERLMERDTHHVQRGHGITIVRLTRNFRSHPSILRFPNEKFYDSALQPFGDLRRINSCLGSSVLVNKNFPIVFHALPGQDDREANSPSFFNRMEILQVKKYIEQLRSSSEMRMSDQEIGVITPYHLQCQKIRAILKPFAEGVKVGSVEEFQGQERRVIIISTVRSNRSLVEYDLRHTLGFVANPRRLNVAITRAQALLIIVGDPAVLSLDPLWRSFLNFVHRNGGWRGDAPTWDTSVDVHESGDYDEETREAGITDMDAFARRMHTMIIEETTTDGEGDTEDSTDRPWRDLE